MLHTFNRSIQEVEAGGCLEFQDSQLATQKNPVSLPLEYPVKAEYVTFLPLLLLIN